ncbi:tail fiber domain-containing protein [Bdellovibrio sp.]|uniref:tail fiber domain-containing protein n=1 Tax=Bdellovibrio sp. TaxID=28201 RepID=UPI0039E6BC5B
MYSGRLSKIRFLAFVGLTISSFSSVGLAQHKGIGFQAVIKRSDGSYPTASGLNVTLQVMSPTGACILREEQFSDVAISNGYLNLVIGQGDTSIPSSYNPTPILSIPEVMDNQTPRTGLKCVDADNNILTSAGAYNPDSSHGRKLRLRTNINGDRIVVDLNMRAVPFAVNSEKLNGKDENDFIQVKPSAQVTQSMLESFFSSITSVAGGAIRWNGTAFESYDPNDGSGLSNDSVPGSAVSDLPWAKLTSVPNHVGQFSGLSCANGKILKMISGAWACGDESGVGVENDPTVQNFAKNPAGAGLRVNGSNNLEVDAGTTSGKIVQLDGSGKILSSVIPSLGVSNLDFAGAMAVNSGVIVSNGTSLFNKTCAADQVLSWTVANGWICSSVGSLVTAAGGLSGNTPISTTANISTNQSVTAGSGIFSLLRIYDGIGKYVSIGTPAAGLINDYTLKLPTDKGTVGQVIKISSVSGSNVELAWETPLSSAVTSVSGTAGEISVATGTTTPVLSLANAGTVGSYYKVTTDAKGRVTSGQAALVAADIPALDWNKITTGKPTTLAGYGISDALPTSLAAGQIIVGNVSGVATPTSMSGDATLSSAGVLSLANSSVGTAEIANSSVTAAKLESASNGQLMIGNGTGFTKANLTGTTNQVVVTSGAGSVTLSTPQNIHTGATPTFAGMTLSPSAAGGLSLNPYGAAAGNTSEVRFLELGANGSHYVGFKAPDLVAATKVWVLPNGDGTNGQVLKTDGSGNLGWVSVATGSVTNVSSANTDISVANGSTTPTLTLNSGTTGGATDANKVAKLNASGLLTTAMIPSLDVSKLTTGTLAIARGGTNSTTALNNNRVMISSSGAIVEHAAITASKALISNASGLPVASTVTETELGYLSGVSSSVQTQLDSKTSSSGWSNNSVITSDSSGVLTALGGSATGSHLQWTVTGPAWTTATYPATTTINQLLYSSGNNLVAGLATANSSVLTTNGSGVPIWSALSNDTFTQYARLAGRAGGQTLNGGTAASENLTLESTSHATKGSIILNGSGGNVGIGAASPASKLDVTGPAGVTSFIGTTPLGVTVRGPTSTNDFGGIDFRANTSTAPLARIGVVFSGAGSYMHLGTSNNYASGITKAALTVDPSGRVGVSTTAPTAPLQVTSGSYAAPATSGTTQSGAFLRLSAIGTTTLDFGYAGTGGAWIQNVMSTDLSSNYPLFLNPNGGNVAVGKLSATYAFNVDGDIHTTTCYRAGAGIVGGTCASDERLKKDIQPFKLGLEALEGVAPKYYRYNGLGGQPSSENLELGVIAQDVEKTAPELVLKKSIKLHPNDVNDTEIKIVNYNGLIYLVINSVKELYHKVLGLDSRVRALEQENAVKTKELEEMKARLERIEKSLSKK